jgi:hypothetical protein
MSDRTRNRINAAFDDELSTSPVPPSLRSLSIRAAVTAAPRRSVQLQLVVVVATIVVIALVATFVVGSHVLRSSPAPATRSGSVVPPAPRANAASAFDQAHGQMVFFGGNAGPGGALNETWTFDGKFWTMRHPTVSPPASFDAEMAYDPVHRQVVMFGGSKARQTWVWSGTSWEMKHPAHTPTVANGGLGPAMQFDPISGKVLVYGSGPDGRGATWSWDGSDWSLLSTSSAPGGIGRMFSDGQSVLLIAEPTAPGDAHDETWQWNSSSWQRLTPKVNLPLIGFADGAYDPERAQLVVLSSDTWTWDGSTWSRQHPSFQPPTPGYVAFIPSLHEVVSWGDAMATDDNRLFGWDGSSWKVLEPGTVVPPATNGKGGFNFTMTSDQAAATVRATVKNTTPVLLPTVLPGGPYDAHVVATVDDFNIQYQSDLRDKIITFGIMAANPPPGGAHPSDTRVRFRNAVALKYGTNGYAEYYVYDTTSPTSQRWLMWLEPGSSTNSMDFNGGVYYYLSSSGLTDQEFWQVANSLQ